MVWFFRIEGQGELWDKFVVGAPLPRSHDTWRSYGGIWRDLTRCEFVRFRRAAAALAALRHYQILVGVEVRHPYVQFFTVQGFIAAT